MLSSDKNVENIGQLAELLKHYLGLQTEYVKLDVIDKVVRLLTAAALAILFFLLIIAVKEERERCDRAHIRHDPSVPEIEVGLRIIIGFDIGDSGLEALMELRIVGILHLAGLIDIKGDKDSKSRERQDHGDYRRHHLALHDEFLPQVTRGVLEVVIPLLLLVLLLFAHYRSRPCSLSIPRSPWP
jgi:hypothetical protein